MVYLRRCVCVCECACVLSLLLSFSPSSPSLPPLLPPSIAILSVLPIHPVLLTQIHLHLNVLYTNTITLWLYTHIHYSSVLLKVRVHQSPSSQFLAFPYHTVIQGLYQFMPYKMTPCSLRKTGVLAAYLPQLHQTAHHCLLHTLPFSPTMDTCIYAYSHRHLHKHLYSWNMLSFSFPPFYKFTYLSALTGDMLSGKGTV